MQIEYDKQAEAVYIRLRKGKVKNTIKLKEGLIIDIGKAGEILGLEILDLPGVFGKTKKSIKQIPVSVL